MAKSGKGSAFEREICKQLSRWWTYGEREDVFWRSAGSGAMAKTRSKAGQTAFGQYGDIQATDPIGQPLIDTCTIELKRGYSKHNFGEVFDKPDTAAQKPWESWIEQAQTDAKLAGSFSWMLITRRDRGRPVVFFSRLLFKALREMDVRFTRAPLVHLIVNLKLSTGTFSQESIFGTSLENFLEEVTPEHIKEL